MEHYSDYAHNSYMDFFITNEKNTAPIQIMKTISVDEWKKCLVKTHKIHSVLRVDSALICNTVGVQGYSETLPCYIYIVKLYGLKKQDDNIGKANETC